MTGELTWENVQENVQISDSFRVQVSFRKRATDYGSFAENDLYR